MACNLSMSAVNSTKSVAQVAEAVTLTDAVDYHITGTTPFTTTGSIDIVNTEHAAIVFESLRPSQAAAQLGFIKINGVAAANGTNCQLRLHGQGTILYPYGREGSTKSSFHALTVYDEPNCQGNSYDLFGLEHSGGFMNTLTDAKMNNRIRSFTLKRGYMVTFSLKAEGRGYSRCFIAADEDLVVNKLPALMDSRISSYRVFRWNDPGKMGVVNLGNSNLQKLNATWTYEWGNGSDRGTDYECVPHMNHRWGPSAATMGSVTYSCHIKTDNEPGNSADPEPATVDQVLARWEDCMRTGKRLMTPSSHDGSMGWFSAFLDSIDKRGWRCEILDFHCYWTEGSYNNLKGYADRYGRPIWISEYVWGASWNNNGIFSSEHNRDNPSQSTLNANRDVMARIWTNLHNWSWVERHCYWNDESNCSKVLRNGNLTPAGEYFSKMKSPLGYTNYGNYVPKAPPYKMPSELTVTNNLKKGINTITWNNPSGELTDSTALQRRMNNTGSWETIATWGAMDQDAFEINDTISEPGLYTYRIMVIAYNTPTKKQYSESASVTVGGSYTAGDVMYGRLQISNDEANSATFAEQENTPYVIVGMPTNANSTTGITSQVTTVGKDNFKFIYRPWTTATSTEITKAETSDFIVMQPGNYTWGDMRAEVGTYHKEGAEQSMIGATEVDVVFEQPFDEGITPVVIAQNQSSAVTGAPVTVQIRDVTNTGFKVKLQAQDDNTQTVRNMYIRYIAITPGEAPISETKKISAGIGAEPVGGTTNREVYFTVGTDTLMLVEPYLLANSQTHNLDYAMLMRRYSLLTTTETNEVDGEEVNTTYTQCFKVRRQMDASVSFDSKTQNRYNIDGDYIGWIAISNIDNGTAVRSLDATDKAFRVQVLGHTICPSAADVRIYDLKGRQMPARQRLSAGIYIVTNGTYTTKVVVK